MSYRRTEIAVGVFLLAGICLVLWGIFKTGGFALGPTRSHYTSYQNVNTIEVGSAVKYNGMLVGRVGALAVDPKQPTLIRVDYDISAAEDIRITDRMEAKITKADLLGDEYIDIRVAGAALGSSEALRPGGTEILSGAAIPAGEPFDLQRALENLQGTISRVDVFLDTAQVEVETAAEEIQAILKDAHEMVSPKNRDNISSAIEDVAATTADLRSMLSENSEQVGSILDSVGSATTNFDTVSAEIMDTVATLRPDLEQLTNKLQSAVSQLQAAAQAASDTLGAVDVAQVNEVVENLDTVSRNLVEFTDEIKQRPYRLIRKGKQPPKEFQ